MLQALEFFGDVQREANVAEISRAFGYPQSTVSMPCHTQDPFCVEAIVPKDRAFAAKMWLRPGTADELGRADELGAYGLADRVRVRSALDRIKGQSPAAYIDSAKIERFGSLMCENIMIGDVPFRKSYLRSRIDAVEVDHRAIRIHG